VRLSNGWERSHFKKDAAPILGPRGPRVFLQQRLAEESLEPDSFWEGTQDDWVWGFQNDGTPFVLNRP